MSLDDPTKHSAAAAEGLADHVCNVPYPVWIALNHARNCRRQHAVPAEAALEVQVEPAWNRLVSALRR